MNHSTNCPLWHCCVTLFAAITLIGCGREPNASTQPPQERSQSIDENSVDEDGGTSVAVTEKSVPKDDTGTPERKISAEAFRIAAYEGEVETVRNAIEGGADVNGKDPAQSLTALHMAAYNGHSEVVKLLLEHDATVDCRDHEGKTPLIHACTGPFAETVEILLDAGADINAQESTEGFTPLMMCAGLGQVEVVKLLLERNADKTILDNDSEKRDSALDHAKNAKHGEIVKLLE